MCQKSSPTPKKPFRRILSTPKKPLRTGQKKTKTKTKKKDQNHFKEETDESNIEQEDRKYIGKTELDMSREEPSNRDSQDPLGPREGNAVRFTCVDASGDRIEAYCMQSEQFKR